MKNLFRISCVLVSILLCHSVYAGDSIAIVGKAKNLPSHLGLYLMKVDRHDIKLASDRATDRLSQLIGKSKQAAKKLVCGGQWRLGISTSKDTGSTYRRPKPTYIRLDGAPSITSQDQAYLFNRSVTVFSEPSKYCKYSTIEMALVLAPPEMVVDANFREQALSNLEAIVLPISLKEDKEQNGTPTYFSSVECVSEGEEVVDCQVADRDGEPGFFSLSSTRSINVLLNFR